MEGIETFVNDCIDRVNSLEKFYIPDEEVFEIPISCIDNGIRSSILKLMSMSNKELNTEWCLEKIYGNVYLRLIVTYVPWLEKSSIVVSANVMSDKGVQTMLSEVLDATYDLGNNMLGCRCISKTSNGNFAIRNVIVSYDDDELEEG